MMDGGRPTAPMTDGEFRMFAELVRGHCGLHFGPDTRFLLEKRIELARALIAWAPYPVFHFWSPWPILYVVFPATVMVAVVYSIARPQRGIPDLVAGTHLVPR